MPGQIDPFTYANFMIIIEIPRRLLPEISELGVLTMASADVRKGILVVREPPGLRIVILFYSQLVGRI